MKEAHFYYNDRMLGIMMYDPELKDGYFFYSFNSPFYTYLGHTSV